MTLRVWPEQLAEGWHRVEMGSTEVRAGFGGETEVLFEIRYI